MLIGQVPDSTLYAHPLKLAVLAGLVFAWGAWAQWVDKDTVRVNTFRVLWNLVVLTAGGVGFALLLFLPVFWAGLLAALLLNAAAAGAYVVHRNGLVEPEFRVLTPAHLRRLLRRDRRPATPREVRELVRVRGPAGALPVPPDPAGREHYAALQRLLFEALQMRAGQIDLIPVGQGARVRFVVDGVPVEREGLDRATEEGVAALLKYTAGLNIQERRKPQTGTLEARVGENVYELRVQTAGSTAGERVTLRVLGEERFFKVQDLGFSPAQLERVRQIMEAPHGLVLLSAPPGHGLTTTIYSFARSHDAFLQNIQIVEYRPELEVENVTHVRYDPAQGKPFVAELQRIVRADPDVVVLPELREQAAAVVASQAAAHKQKVYVGLVSVDLFDALRQWMALVGDMRLVARSLLAVTHQRLIRRLCTVCRQPYRPDPATLRKINMPPDRVLYRPPGQQFDKNGKPIICQNCFGTGYVGRTGVFTLLVVDDALREVMARGASLGDIQAQAIKAGGLSLQQQALQRVFDGTTSVEEVVRVTRQVRGPEPARRAAAAPPRPAVEPEQG